MFDVLLQDWTTVHVTGTATAIQSEPEWLDVMDYRDVTLWLETRGILLAGAAPPILAYETAPSKDESLFSTLATLTLSGNSIVITKVLVSQNPTVPLSAWLRWKLTISGSPTQEWGATFRIFCSLNANGRQ